MNYKKRNGITRVCVCGAWLLIPTRAASESCPNIATLSFPDLIIWRQVEKEKDTEAICDFYSSFTCKPKEEVRERVLYFLDRMYEKGFLVPASEDVY